MGEANVGCKTMYFVYVLKSKKDDNLYIGCTEDLERRLKYHNSGKVRSTKPRIPFEVLYHETFTDKYEAFKREKYYKTARGKKELKLKI
jgi:putative endonuclease